jgi:RNA polymerase sigma-70 factor (ECF subfamily)
VSGSAQTRELLDHLFRHQAGRITARLVRLLSPARLDLAEEAVQEALVRALETWPYQGVPGNPPAWLFQVAHNAAIDAIRRQHLLGQKREAIVAELTRSSLEVPGSPDFEDQLRDDELRMIFMCCHPEIPRDARVALSLKMAGGFGVREIAAALLREDQTVAQQLVRAKRKIREERLSLEIPPAELEARLDSVLEVVYLIFNEGYSAHEGEHLVRQDLCEEAVRLGRLLASSSLTRPKVHALVAMMSLQAARLSARTSETGDLVLLEDQDREHWDQRLISLGFHHFDLAMAGEEVSEYHVQAAIAATYARAAGGQPLEWPVLLELYDQLLELSGSPVVALNRAVVIAKVRGAEQALAVVESLAANAELRDYYLLLAVRGHLLKQLHRGQEAAGCFRAALERRCSEPERRFLRRMLAECDLTGASPRA